MPVREPQRTLYIEQLYKEGNVEGLIAEREAIDKVIENYSNKVLNIVDMLDFEKKDIEKNIEYEKSVRDKIDELLFLINNY